MSGPGIVERLRAGVWGRNPLAEPMPAAQAMEQAADVIEAQTKALEEARERLANHPPYAAGTTFAEIWQWLEAKGAAIATIDAALALSGEER